MSSPFLNVLVKHYEAKMLEAKANLDVLLNNMVGIGEHTDYLLDLKKWVGELDDARSCLETLKATYPE